MHIIGPVQVNCFSWVLATGQANNISFHDYSTTNTAFCTSLLTLCIHTGGPLPSVHGKHTGPITWPRQRWN